MKKSWVVVDEDDLTKEEMYGSLQEARVAAEDQALESGNNMFVAEVVGGCAAVVTWEGVEA